MSELGGSLSPECTEVRDVLPELALGVLGGGERAHVLAHLDACRACREPAAGYAETVDALALAVPEVEPPLGFEQRTLARLRAERDVRPRRPVWKVLAAVAAVVAATTMVSVSVVKIVDVRSSARPSATEVRTSPMMGGNGQRAGRAFTTSGEGPYVFVAVSYGVPNGAYQVEVLGTGGRVARLGAVTITDGQGAWAGESPESVGALRSVRLVDRAGLAVCEARFATQEA